MHDGTQFLAALVPPRVSVVRRISGCASPSPTLDSVPLRALFVVTCKNDPAVHAGTEFLGIIQRIHDRGALVHTRVLLDATADSLQTVISEFRPGVVHFIGHGVAGALYLKPSNSEKPREYGAQALLNALRGSGGGGELPKVVVLNVCDSASIPIDLDSLGKKAECLATGLVAGGVPLVVGMAGRIADDACRLFARRFYENLFTPEARVDVAEVTAAGRRAASATFVQGVDWALPRLVADDRLSDFVVAVAPLDRPNLREYYTTFAFMKIKGFCDRRSLVESFMTWLTRQQGKPPQEWMFTLYSTRKPDGPLGLTWAMRELATRSVYEGFVPVFIDHSAQDNLSLAEFGRSVREAIATALERLAVDVPPEPSLTPEEENDPKIQARHIAAHLVELRKQLSARALRPILFVDSLQVYVGAVQAFEQLFSPNLGFGKLAPGPDPAQQERTPVVLSFYVDIKPALTQKLEEIAAGLGTRSFELKSFDEPETAYLEYLLFKRLVPTPAAREKTLKLFRRIPSLLRSSRVEMALDDMEKTWEELVPPRRAAGDPGAPSR